MPSAFEREILLDFSQFSAEQARLVHIQKSREALRDFLSRQEVKPEYIIMVDGHEAASEDSVRPFGKIEYVFLRLAEIGKYAITTARNISPVESGRYKNAWFLLVDNVEVSENDIPKRASELILTNDQPYARKIERRGARIAGVPPGIVERIRQMTLRKYKALVDINIQYLTLSGGYKLKNPIRRRGQTERQLTYPALVIRSRF